MLIELFHDVLIFVLLFFLNVDYSHQINLLNINNHFKLKAEEELRMAQTEFDRQCELTKLLMDEINVSYVSLN